VLTVVEQQQHVPVGQVPPQHITRYVQRSATIAEHTRRRSRNVFWRAHQGKINQPNDIGSLPRLTTPQLDGHSGLPRQLGRLASPAGLCAAPRRPLEAQLRGRSAP
jgi:hypothetical protein